MGVRKSLLVLIFFSEKFGPNLTELCHQIILFFDRNEKKRLKVPEFV